MNENVIVSDSAGKKSAASDSVARLSNIGSNIIGVNMLMPSSENISLNSCPNTGTFPMPKGNETNGLPIKPNMK